jgi:large subunit ribosomal protein L4
MKLQVFSLDNKKVKQVEVPEGVFTYPYKEHLIHLAVVAVRAGWRAGTHKAKNRSDVRGSNRKLYRQKGTGRARVGDAASPIRRGGGVVHGPRPRDYTKALTPREKRNALKSALSRKLAEEKLIVVDNFDLDQPKTQGLLGKLASLGVDGKALIIDQYNNDNLALASRNVQALKAVDALGVNVYDVVDRNHVLISESALERLVGVLDR